MLRRVGLLSCVAVIGLSVGMGAAFASEKPRAVAQPQIGDKPSVAYNHDEDVPEEMASFIEALRSGLPEGAVFTHDGASYDEGEGVGVISDIYMSYDIEEYGRSTNISMNIDAMQLFMDDEKIEGMLIQDLAAEISKYDEVTEMNVDSFELHGASLAHLHDYIDGLHRNAPDPKEFFDFDMMVIDGFHMEGGDFENGGLDVGHIEWIQDAPLDISHFSIDDVALHVNDGNERGSFFLENFEIEDLDLSLLLSGFERMPTRAEYEKLLSFDHIGFSGVSFNFREDYDEYGEGSLDDFAWVQGGDTVLDEFSVSGVSAEGQDGAEHFAFGLDDYALRDLDIGAAVEAMRLRVADEAEAWNNAYDRETGEYLGRAALSPEVIEAYLTSLRRMGDSETSGLYFGFEDKREDIAIEFNLGNMTQDNNSENYRGGEVSYAGSIDDVTLMLSGSGIRDDEEIADIVDFLEFPIGEDVDIFSGSWGVSYAPEAEIFALDDLSMSLYDFVDISASYEISGFSPEYLVDSDRFDDEVKDSLYLNFAETRIEDRGRLESLVSLMAAIFRDEELDGPEPDLASLNKEGYVIRSEVVDAIKVEIGNDLDSMPVVRSYIEKVFDFIIEPRDVILSLRPQRPVNIDMIEQSGDNPDLLLNMLGLQIDLD